MKRLATLIATVTLMLNLGVAASYAQTLNLTISGTAAPSTVDLGTGTGTSEYNLAANGGSFTFRTVKQSRRVFAAVQHLLGCKQALYSDSGRNGRPSLS